jgi:hypothetical protein
VRPLGFILVASLAGAAAAAACSSFGASSNEEPPPLDAADEASSTGDDASSTDASSTDSSTTRDASSDAPDAPVSIRPCADPAAHWLCDDFDRSTQDFPKWGSTIVSGDGGVTIERFASAQSQPNVLTSRVDTGDEARLTATHFMTATGLRCEMDLFVEQRTGGEIPLFVVDIDDADYYYRIELRSNYQSQKDGFTGYGSLEGGALPNIHHDLGFQLDAAWHHIAVQVGVGATQVFVSVDGKSLIDLDAGPLDGIQTLPTTQGMSVGAQLLGGSGPWTVHYDNVFCDPLP